MDTFNNSHDFSRKTMWNAIISGYEPTLDQVIVASQPFVLSMLETIDNPTEKMMDQRENYETVKADQKKKNQTVKQNKHSKKVNFAKRKWTKSEDKVLVQQVNCYGDKNWAKITKAFNGRTGKQCRERWLNHLHPDIKRGGWTKEEDRILIEAHKTHGNKWSEISKSLPGRCENSVKNRWNATKRRVMLEKAKESRENVKAQHHDLENYIEHVAINNATEINGETSNDKEDDAYVFDNWNMNWNRDLEKQIAEQLVVDPATTSSNVPKETTFAEEENLLREFSKPMGETFTQMLKRGLE